MRKRREEFVSEIQGVLIVKIQNSNISHHSQSPNKHFKMIIPTSRSAGISVLVFVICTVDAREKRKADFLHVIRIQLSLILKTLFFIKVLQFIVKKIGGNFDRVEVHSRDRTGQFAKLILNLHKYESLRPFKIENVDITKT